MWNGVNGTGVVLAMNYPRSVLKIELINSRTMWTLLNAEGSLDELGSKFY
jgi:hypothetical protein